MDVPSNTAARQIADLMFRLLANCQAKEERLAKQFGVTVAEFRCLRAFRGAQETPVGDLVERVDLSPSRVTRILESLEKKGYLLRTVDTQDRRSVIVRLTPPGMSMSAGLEERYVAMHEEILNGIPSELHGPLAASLQGLLASLTSWLGREG